jgi:hypothetical protein
MPGAAAPSGHARSKDRGNSRSYPKWRIVPQFEIRLLRPRAKASPRQQENATEHDKHEARPIRFQCKPGTRPTRLQSVAWYSRSCSFRITEPPSPDRLSHHE